VGRSGQGRGPVPVAPAAPGAHHRAVSGAGVIGLGAAAVGAGRVMGRGQAAVVPSGFSAAATVPGPGAAN
jgi:hypothetical protein